MDTIDEAWLGPGLLALRWWAMLSVQILWQRVVGLWWPAVAAGLSVVLALGAGPVGGLSGDPWLLAVAELLLGGLLGLAVALPGIALMGSAQATARVLSIAPGPWRALTLCLVAAIGLGVGLHRPLLVGGQALGEAWPVGQRAAWEWSVAAVSLPQLAHAMALLALTLATPALLAAAVAELSMRLIGRGPVAVGPPARALAPLLRVAAALVATGASWAAYDVVWAERALVPVVLG